MNAYYRHQKSPSGQSHIDRFERLYLPEPNSGCWLWIGAGRSTGYGAFVRKGCKSKSAHRASYELFKGAIPDGRLVCHRCDVPCCVNPDHLFLGSYADNMADMDRKGRRRVTRPFGEKSPTAKLTSDDVIAIRRAAASGEAGVSLARKFGVSKTNIYGIIHGRIWPHIPAEVSA